MSAMMGRRYLVHERIGAGGMGIVFRATDRLTGSVIALKQVVASPQKLVFASSHDSSDYALSLAQEFRLLASLHHPYIIGVLDYGFDPQRQPFFTMEYLHNAQTILMAAFACDLTVQVGMLVQMLQALAYLHRRGVIHRDLKPGNVLAIEGQVKVLDFGLSLVRDQLPDSGGDAVGTIAYMAPEVMMGQPTSEASDLYAAGVIAYEMILNHHPFLTRGSPSFVDDVLHAPPDVSALSSNPRLAEILSRLLAKQPEQRYASAEEVISALSEAIDQPIPVETSATRESYLQAAGLIGRDAELQELSQVLNQTVKGSGDAWFIAGESGVGKSRLLDEVRTLALVKGVLVMRGQALNEGSGPYQLWREVLRWLALTVDLDDLEAGVFKPLVPDISTLLGREVPDVPRLDPQAMQTRLLTILENVLRRQTQPMLMLLEDVQWAGSESLAVLSYLTRFARDLPLLIIASLRSDDNPALMASLPATFPSVHLLELHRLNEQDIARLSEAMLGSAGTQQQVLNLLQRETEGNIFFLVETVRALAEEAGRLDRIGDVTLPAKVSAGGIRQLVQRRLKRVPDEDHRLLQIAAVVGRQLDLDVLRAVDPAADLAGWLTVCANAAVLEVQEGRWRFAHDKLRDGLLVDLPEIERRGLHRQVAVAIEQAHPDAPEQAALLAYHWHEAGDQAKEALYATLAGEQALQNGAFQVAIQFLERAAVLAHSPEAGVATRQLARLEGQLGQAYLGLGRLIDSRDHLRRSIALLRRAVPASQIGMALGVVRQMAQQATHRLRPTSAVARSEEERADLRLAARNYQSLAEIHYFANEIVPGVHAALSALNIAERAGASATLVRAYSNMCVAMGIVALRGLADSYAEQARLTARQLDQPQELAYTLAVVSAYHISVGKWQQTEDDLNTAMHIFEAARDRRMLLSSQSVAANLAEYRGQFREAAAMYAQLYDLASRSEDIQQQLWGLTGQAENIIRLGRFEEAIDLLQQTLPLHAMNIARHSQIISHGLLGLAYLRQGQFALARQAADTAADLIARSSPTQYAAMEGCAGAAEVYLSLWEITGTPDAALKAQAAKLCKAMHDYAHSFPIGRPRAALYQGLNDWLRGQPAEARKSWQKSLSAAKQLAMPYEEALAYYEIGRHADDGTRLDSLTRARDMFRQLGAVYDAQRAEDALSPT